MIVVIADDFTGAAELAGVGWRYALNTELQTLFDPASDAHLLVIDADSRSRSPQQAADRVRNMANQLTNVQVDWLYKKVDSVLRGSVLAELVALLSAVAQDRVLLLPANPSAGRQIRAGQYYVHGQALHKTDFARDPEHPTDCADVVKLLGRSKGLVISAVRRPQRVGANSITVGDAESKQDLLAWAKQLDRRTVAAGAAEFFAAVLETRGHQVQRNASQVPPTVGQKELFVCTSVSDYSRQAVEQARDRGLAICEMPPQLFKSQEFVLELLQQWTDEALVALAQHQRAIVTIAQTTTRSPELAQRLRQWTARLVEQVFERSALRDLYVEGGATASAIVHRLGWRQFVPKLELAPGVVRMTVRQKPNFYLTIKPGSYPWPDNIWTRT
ncbi:MAG: four-carbon acid sugar kinase family protein [Planctomycetota bacterium]|jgi:uncharacterized protein YgbK (DUF1537 family)